MRIIAGTHRSRVIKAVSGDTTRPTTDKIKEAIFSRIGPYFEGGRMLDLFGGSGNMSFEAISRGMLHSHMFDTSFTAIKVMKENAITLKMDTACTIMKMDYHRALSYVSSQAYKFDLVYLDPPYKEQQLHVILSILTEQDLIQDDGYVICESLKEDVFADTYGKLEKCKDVTYGITRITYYKKR